MNTAEAMDLAEEAYGPSPRTVYVIMRSPGGANSDMSECFLVFTDKEKCKSCLDKIDGEKERLHSHSLPKISKYTYSNIKHLQELLSTDGFSFLKEAMTHKNLNDTIVYIDIDSTFYIQEVKLVI